MQTLLPWLVIGAAVLYNFLPAGTLKTLLGKLVAAFQNVATPSTTTVAADGSITAIVATWETLDGQCKAAGLQEARTALRGVFQLFAADPSPEPGAAK